METIIKLFRLIFSHLSFRTLRSAATFFALTAALLLTTCKKEPIPCLDDKTFCSLVNAQNFDGNGQIIDNFLATLQNDDKALEKLTEWLNCKSCVQKAIIICKSCIYTDPPLSEIHVKFEVNGQIVEKKLFIRMGDTLTFAGYHLQ